VPVVRGPHQRVDGHGHRADLDRAPERPQELGARRGRSSGRGRPPPRRARAGVARCGCERLQVRVGEGPVLAGNAADAPRPSATFRSTKCAAALNRSGSASDASSRAAVQAAPIRVPRLGRDSISVAKGARHRSQLGPRPLAQRGDERRDRSVLATPARSMAACSTRAGPHASRLSSSGMNRERSASAAVPRPRRRPRTARCSGPARGSPIRW
jgi:hypothetical protein